MKLQETKFGWDRDARSLIFSGFLETPPAPRRAQFTLAESDFHGGGDWKSQEERLEVTKCHLVGERDLRFGLV
jgi:hypothetical protein